MKKCEYRGKLETGDQFPIYVCTRDFEPEWKLIPSCSNPDSCDFLLIREAILKEVGEWLKDNYEGSYGSSCAIRMMEGIDSLLQGMMPGEEK